ncbi:MAG: LysR substrate-binding domain-containing protein [Proteobacteria bacterium]|nr:LysR substrate-binding domain-containing protein [Pseudomonadota bacterium]MDA1063665.1 LysR substrate-binding domain-containing protein [Pseudomonadota bacterium]
MTLIQLKYLLGVVDNGLNITAAADRLFTSQPGISKQLRQLEQEVGVQIFSRKGKALIGVTPAGATIVDYARKIMRDVENIRSVGQDLMSEQDGTLSIATTNTQARYVLPEVISRFHERYPNVNIELHQGTSEQIADLVAEGRVDFAIATDSQSLFPELNLLPCFHWDRIVLTRKDHALATSKKTLSLQALAEHPLITYVFSSNRGSSFLRAFENEHLQPNVVFTARDADVIKTYVRMGMGVGVLAPMAVLDEDLKNFHVTCAKGLFPTVTTWIGIPRDRALRRYMLDFIALFAPHWSRELIELATTAGSQEQVDKLARQVDIPTRTGCEIGIPVAA